MDNESSMDPEQVIVELMLEAGKFQSFEAFDKLKKFQGGLFHVRARHKIKRQIFCIRTSSL